MSDEKLRQLQRLAETGGPEDIRRFIHGLILSGISYGNLTSRFPIELLVSYYYDDPELFYTTEIVNAVEKAIAIALQDRSFYPPEQWLSKRVNYYDRHHPDQIYSIVWRYGRIHRRHRYIVLQRSNKEVNWKLWAYSMNSDLAFARAPAKAPQEHELEQANFSQVVEFRLLDENLIQQWSSW